MSEMIDIEGEVILSYVGAVETLQSQLEEANKRVEDQQRIIDHLREQAYMLEIASKNKGQGKYKRLCRQAYNALKEPNPDKFGEKTMRIRDLLEDIFG